MIRSTKKGRIGKGRSSYYSVIQIEITNLNFKPIGKNYIVCVQDYAITINEDSSIVKTPIGEQREVNYPKEKIDGLFHYLNNPIEANENFSDDFYSLLVNALLFVTQSETEELQDENGGMGIFTTNYELQPQDWEIVNEN